MNAHATHDAKPTFLDHLTSFLTRHRKVLLIVLIVIAASVVTLFVGLSVASRRTEKSLVRVETLQSDFDAWVALDDTERPTKFEPLALEADDIATTYPRSYAAQRALYIKAGGLAELGRWNEAVGSYEELADRFPESYLAPLALLRAAVAAENDGDTTTILAILNRILDDYGSENAIAARALFSVARIHETEDRIADAADAYNRLITDYPNSGWTNLARDRIITLTAEGRIGS